MLWPAIGLCQSARTRDYSAPAACPDRAWFEAELGSRLGGHSETTRDLRVRVEETTGGFVGWVRLGAASEAERREVRHASCEQLVRALALIGALLLDPSAEEATATATKEPSAAEPLPQNHERAHARPTAPRQTAPLLVERREPWRFAHGPRIGLALQALVAKGVAPGLRAGYRALAAHGRYESELLLAVSYVRSGTQRVTGLGSAEFTFFAVRPELCQTIRAQSPLTLGPCAWLDIGTLQGEGQIIGKAAVSHRTSWLSPGLSGKLEWRPLGPLTVTLDAGAFFPLQRPKFYFSDRAANREYTLLRIPKKPGFSGELSLGLLFW